MSKSCSSHRKSLWNNWIFIGKKTTLSKTSFFLLSFFSASLLVFFENRLKGYLKHNSVRLIFRGFFLVALSYLMHLYLSLTVLRSFLFVANINDRSMLGKRDSEIASIMKDKEFVSLISTSQIWFGKSNIC